MQNHYYIYCPWESLLYMCIMGNGNNILQLPTSFNRGNLSIITYILSICILIRADWWWPLWRPKPIINSGKWGDLWQAIGFLSPSRLLVRWWPSSKLLSSNGRNVNQHLSQIKICWQTVINFYLSLTHKCSVEYNRKA